MDRPNQAEWYLLQFKPNAYKIAERNLRRQGFETFIPMLETTTRDAERFVKSVKPMFPGYMFVSFVTEAAPWRKINSTIGVSRLVTFSDGPKPVPSTLVKALKEKADEAKAVDGLSDFDVGDKVLFKNGPFADFIAKVDQIDAQQRIWILMDILGRETRLQISPSQLSRIDS